MRWGAGGRDEGRTKGHNFFLKFNGRITLLRKQDHGPKAPSLASSGEQSNGEEGQTSDGVSLRLWKANAHLKISTATDQSQGECQDCVHTRQLHELSSANRDILNPAKLGSGLSVQVPVIHK